MYALYVGQLHGPRARRLRRSHKARTSYISTSRSSSSSSSAPATDVTAEEVTSGRATVPVPPATPPLPEAGGQLPMTVLNNGVVGGDASVASAADAADAERELDRASQAV